MENSSAIIQVGTSGYSFEDWRQSFYPEKIEKGKMLDHYAMHFDCVEINSTYYRIPHPAVFYNMIKKVSPQFEFIVKVPQSFTHGRTEIEHDANSFIEAITPLRESKQLKGLLAQFPYSFKFNQNNLDYLSICNELCTPTPLFVEFRHNSWVNRPMYDHLVKGKIGYVCVDEPQLNGLLKPDAFATTNSAYIRLHGRNTRHWWQGGDLRYDYNYSTIELEEWRNKIFKLKAKVKKVYIFFNNCHHGQAAKNALEFKKMLGL